MVRQKLKKICAGVLVASMLLQTLPAQAQAEEKVNTTVMASEVQEDTQTPNGSATQSNGTTSENESGKNDSNETNAEQPDDASENNSKSEAGENQPENESNKSDSNIEESAQENTKQTDAEQETTADEANPTGATGNEIQVVDNKVTLTSTADFINLSIQPAEKYETAEITITRGTNTSFDLTQSIDGKTFQGFGNADHPFKGTIKITSQESGIDIPIKRPFFNYLDQSATINAGLYLKAKGTVDGPLLAANYVNRNSAEAKTISLMIGAEKEDNNLPSFGGIIGTMDSNTSLSLSVANKITEANTTITGTGNLGFFCNTMGEGANLTIASYTDGNSTNSGSTGSGTATIGYNISTTGGHSGGLVGEMQNGSTLTVNPALNLTGNVTTTTVTGFAAGGLIGAATNPTITWNQVTRTGKIEGTSESGGFIGKAVYKTELELDLSKINVSGITISNGNHAGGYFGVLNFDSASGDTITIKTNSQTEQTELTHTGESWQFGGVIGQYSANSQSSTLKLESPNVKINGNGTVTALGGIIGFVAGSGADHGFSTATSSYVEISDATVTANLTTDSTTVGYFGGLVGELGQAEGQGHFLSVSGATMVSGNDNGKAGKLGGILGKSTKGILRISGTTNLSGLTIAKTGTECGQIAGSIDGTIVYALGSGNGTGGEGYEWKYIRPAAVSVSDIGSYGEVIRLDGSNLKETDGSSVDSNTLFTKDPNSHQFSVFSVAYTQGDALEVSNARDLAAIAVLLQQGNDLLNRNITVNCDVDLTGTGIYSLLRDNGSQKYTGTFDGNGHTITLAAGEAYGYLSDRSTLAENAGGTSATVGIGQIYNHSTIGFIPYCNGTVQNLTLDGSIYFHNVSNGEVVHCGAVAGDTNGAAFKNVTVNTNIVYRDGAGGGELSVMSIGGFLGRAKGTTTFTGCSMQGTISSSSGCYDFAIGGYVAAGEEGANISFSNCGISNATIKHEKFKDNSNAPNAKFGGLIGCMTGNVTIDRLTINNLQMETYATETAGGLLGYYWRKNSATDSVSIKNLVVQDSTLNVQGKFGGLVYSTDAYWKIGDGTGENGIKFSKATKQNSFSGKTDEANPSALLVCSTIQDEASKKYDKAYIEISKDGLKIEENAVNVTLTGGDYFDDIAGKTKYGEDGNNAVVSIGLTSPDATTATLIDQDKDKCNTWTNQCNVNSGKSYTNKNTRYYYNVDYYRVKDGTDTNITEIDSAGKLLLRSLYVYAQPNLQQYFIKGSDDFKLTGNIDLTGVSYYPMSRAITIQDATVIFDYTKMNTNTEKKYNDSNQQHYQMQTGLFSKISQKFTVNGLTLQGTFGKYEDGKAGEKGKAGVLICDSIAQESANKDQAGITITNLKLDGIQCNDGTNLPLLVNSVGSNTAISMNDVTFTREEYPTSSALTGNKVASALMGQVGSGTAQKISLEFSNMDLNRAGNDSIFNTAIFATAFQYGDGASGGSYNFESTTEKITFGKEISNGVKPIGNLSGYNRNSYNDANMTGQVWYLDTFGNTTAGSYVGADTTAIQTGNESGNKPSNSPQDFSGYLPYIGTPENSADKYYELDINQKAVYLDVGCGTYGHPWVIKNKNVSSTDGSNQTLFTGEDQMMTVMKLLDDTGRNGTAIKINTTILTTKMDGQGGIDVHTGDASDDMVFIKNGNTWVEATLAGNRYVQKTDSNATTLTNEQVMAYLRNGYFQIKEDLTLDVAQFTGFGKDDVSRAFSGVIVGDTAARTITLTGVNTTGEVGGLIRYSQGSVVKNLTIVLENVTFNGNSTETFFGGVIGWVIGGDNIIDNVTLTVNSVNKGSFASNLTAVGGYVGMVGGYVKTVGSTTIDQSKKGGGVVFRNISSAGLTSISGTATNTEVSPENTNYYWNPYVGRVLDGYACEEKKDTCSGMGTNTDKNYTIPKLDKNVKLKIKGNTGANTYSIAGTAYPNSTITLDSTQSIWLLSAIVNSGFGAKTAGNNFDLTSSNGKTDYRVNASYYGRTRTGTYDGVGTASNQADIADENDYWGGKLTATSGAEVDRRKYSTSYLSTYVETQNNVDAKAVTYSLTMDNNGRSVKFGDNGNYDLSSYGNGFRGIGYNYGLPTDSTRKDIQKSRALRLQNQTDDTIAVNGNHATITYSRTIYEIADNDISVSQAGFFTQCLANSGVDYTVKDLKFTGVILKKNVGKDKVALGVVFARDGAYSPKNLTFENVSVTESAITESAIDQADQSAAVIGYMSNSTKNISIKFISCQVRNFTAGKNTSDSTNKMNHCGAFIGKAESPANGADSTNRKVEFENCTANNIKLYNVQNGGLFAGYVNGTCTINGGSADTGTITSRTAVGGGYSMGGLIGKAESTLNIEGTTETPISVQNINIRETKHVNSTSNSYAGGVAGSAASTNIQNVNVENVRLAGKDLGGLIGCVNGGADVKNVKISNSYLANCSATQNAVGGFFGIIKGTFNGFNLLSKDNVIGYAVKDNKLLSSVGSEALSSLSADSIGLQLEDGTYATYNSLTANATLKAGIPCGIWVGNANNTVKIVSASRQGNYSAVNNIGTGKNESSYVIYADYTGRSITSSTVNTKPDAIVTAGGTSLTGDGATKVDGTAVRDSIISDIMTNPSLMKGYYGGNQNRPLDEIVQKFGTNGDYSSRLSNYQKEDTSYKSDDFPILVLNATTKSELNSIVNNYISMLTNTKQEQSKRYYDKIEPKTYKYENNAWNLVSAENQTMSWNSTDGVSINRGKYDNNKQQITILDVKYYYPINAETPTDVYHLYIPVLVKKLMDVECSVKVVNGAAGYDSATDGNATLNSFGENYTAHISYTYKWMVSEWQSMLENGDSLLWNFDKTVKLGSFGTLDRSKIHLTLVDMNTQGTQTSYHQSTLEELSTAGALTNDKLNLAEMAKQGKAPYICDLLPLEATESETGGFKIVESTDSSAVLRIWDNTENTFIYYTAKSDADAKETKYYDVTLNTKCGLNDILPVTEEYYLVMNCTEGNQTTPMLNTTLELNQPYSNQQIPTKVTGNFNVVYLLGDFYKLDNVKLESEGNPEMVSGSNDSIKVTVSSKVSAAANENEFGSYVNERSIYYQYSLQTVDQNGNPVKMKGAASIPTLKLEKENAETHELKQLTDLSGTENGFITQFGENGYIITIKAPGAWYTGATITAEMSFSYNSTEMNQQFPLRTSGSENSGVKFKVDAVMAYQQDSLGSSSISASASEEKLYYQLKEAQAKLSYDSYNITSTDGNTSPDGNTSQLGINGRENNDAAMEISSRALLDVTDFSNFNLTDESNSTYPYYLEGELTLAKKTDSGNGTSYQNVAIEKYLSEFEIESAGTKLNVDVTSEGLGLQENNTVYKFRIRLTQDQVSKILDTPLLVNIKYKVKTGEELEVIKGGQYANYKVTLSATLKNQKLDNLLIGTPSDYLIYTNAKVYLKIVG